MPRLDETYNISRPQPRLLRKAAEARRLDRFAEQEAISGHDWHNDYARLMLQVQHQLRTAKTDLERQRLLRKMQRILGRG